MRAERRLVLLKKRFEKDDAYRQRYAKVIEAYLKDGHAKAVDDIGGERGELLWYLSYHGVINPKKPEKLHVVFDCAAEYRNVSLNKALMSGPDLTNSLVGVLIGFRENLIAVASDIKSMFHQV